VIAGRDREEASGFLGRALELRDAEERKKEEANSLYKNAVNCTEEYFPSRFERTRVLPEQSIGLSTGQMARCPLAKHWALRTVRSDFGKVPEEHRS